MKPKDFDIFTAPLKSIKVLKLLNDALKEHERDILDLQKEQMSAGLAERGDDIQPAYSPVTIEKKKLKGQEWEHVTLKDTGAFYADQYVKFMSSQFEITSRNRKRKKLVEKYQGNRGGDIFGLTPESREELCRIILPLLQYYYQEKLLKK